jgi:hypothetical protein
MSLLFDKYNLFNQSSEHDWKMSECAEWVKHYNNFLSWTAITTEEQRSFFEEELQEYLCYDV